MNAADADAVLARIKKVLGVDDPQPVIDRWVADAEARDDLIGDPLAVLHSVRDDRKLRYKLRRHVASIPMRPPWCGNCDQSTRMVEVGDERLPAHCPNCHPATAAA